MNFRFFAHVSLARVVLMQRLFESAGRFSCGAH